MKKKKLSCSLKDVFTYRCELFAKIMFKNSDT